MNSNLESSVLGHWVHSHEEDSGGQIVFRPVTHAFPPSRGRYEYRIEPGGALHVVRPGPADKRESVDGTWTLEPGGILELHPAGGAIQRYSIVSVDATRLVVNRL